jgi:hypothetical protein
MNTMTPVNAMATHDESAAVERRLREQVAACTLMLNELGILGYSGHVSARLPGGHGFLIQSFDQSRAALPLRTRQHAAACRSLPA